MGLFSKKKNLVGLDVGSSSVKAVEMKPGKGESWQLTTIGLEYLPPEAIVDGQIMDSTSVIDAIQRLFSEYKIKTTDVATSISGSSVIVKKIQLPAMSEQELAESIHWEAEQYIPFDIQEVNLDYQVIDPGAAGGNMDILLVAAKKDKINDYQSVITQAGRNPVVMDVDAFALQNAYEMNYGIEPGRVVAMVNIGASQANINVVRGETSIFTRDITTIGGNLYTEAIQKDLNLTQEQAENTKLGHGENPESLAGDSPFGHRFGAARGPEDVRLLQGHDFGRSHRPYRSERWKREDSRPVRCHRRAFRHSSGNLQSLSEHELQPEGLRCRISRGSRARLCHRRGPGHEKGW